MIFLFYCFISVSFRQAGGWTSVIYFLMYTFSSATRLWDASRRRRCYTVPEKNLSKSVRRPSRVALDLDWTGLGTRLGRSGRMGIVTPIEKKQKSLCLDSSK